MEEYEPYFAWLEAVANSFAIIAYAVALAVYFINRKKLSVALQLLLNFSFQTTLAELKEKLERLNEYNASDPEDLGEIRNILHEIAGQIRGNSRLSKASPAIADKVEAAANSKKLMETMKRSIVSELREKLRNIQVNDMGNTGGDRE